MASNRKKQDEKHLKILRNLVSLPANKQCFDCNQRGPTYVNTTIGSFVCTTCSGLLRGLTPPHRVKSISMATFTPEEIESLKSRGNEYCRKVWLALYDSNHTPDTKDEQHVKDFMIAKYEKKRYYVEPSAALRNGNSHSPTPPQSQTSNDNVRLQRPNAVYSSSHTSPPPPHSASINSIIPPKIPQTHMNTFPTSVSAFNLSDPFGPVTSTRQQQIHQQRPQPSATTQASFANFDDNPIFNSSPVIGSTMTTSISFPSATKPRPPSEDKYAALKDLDCLMKMQQESQTQSQQSQSQSQIPPNQALPANGWASSTAEGNNFFNPFSSEAGKYNFVPNPFRSNLVQQMENSNSNNMNNSSSNNCNPWGSNNPWATNTMSTSQSVPFSSASWNGNGNITQVIPGNSSNPFL